MKFKIRQPRVQNVHNVHGGAPIDLLAVDSWEIVFSLRPKWISFNQGGMLFCSETIQKERKIFKLNV